jgi:hypothetical protein
MQLLSQPRLVAIILSCMRSPQAVRGPGSVGHTLILGAARRRRKRHWALQSARQAWRLAAFLQKISWGHAPLWHELAGFRGCVCYKVWAGPPQKMREVAFALSRPQENLLSAPYVRQQTQYLWGGHTHNKFKDTQTDLKQTKSPQQQKERGRVRVPRPKSPTHTG